MASGEKKAAIMAKGLQGKSTEEIPLSVIHLIPQGFVMLDEDAARL
jgi:6-phosphogluconolactonase/glucosamine-6-phosphate isomerase/deaminase